MSNSIWHKKYVFVVDKNGQVVVKLDDGTYDIVWVKKDNPLQDVIVFSENGIKFIEEYCYINDLIAQADKAERLQKAVIWLVGGDTGISSKTMCAALFGATPKDSDMPHDAGDFGRCLRFIRFMPDGTKDIVFKKLSDKPEWVEIGKRWDELVDLYDQENWRGIYDILSAIRKEYRQPRPNEIFIGL